MRIEAKGHWGGDPAEAASELRLRVETMSDARKLALLNRVLSEPETRDRLLELADRIECEQAVLVGAKAVAGFDDAANRGY